MTRAEHAAFIKGLEAARRLAQKRVRWYRGRGEWASSSAASCVRLEIEERIRRERAKMKETKG